ncbi:trifunctional serine/threonine-protein kinase/ATP-binding protein/sensor histidine kinase [Archangium lansingense]|uniref:trifunctional serine/threonine-protein kinase/ATP-binding protein/sensor histidine kinase n=1 Tax=Archangium lansingense TaxID=2995310 RepID=UPI003B7E2578
MNSFAGYSLQETLFTSSRSIIYRATRNQDARPVVLKVLNAEFPSTEQAARLHREYRLTRTLAMDGIIEVLGLERFGTRLAIVFEDFGAVSLSRQWDTRPMELSRFLPLALRLSTILAYVHQRQVIHKDINPSNIVCHPETGELKLIDFGIATELVRETPAVLSLNVLEGTLPYMSPEATGRMNRALDYRTDFYSLGVTFYELLTGRVPFSSTDPMELVHCHLARIPLSPHERVPGIPVAVSQLVMRLLSKRAEERYQSAFALARDLRRCLDSLQSEGRLSPFELGRGDVSERLQLPQNLYGRQREIDALLTVFGRVADGGAELVLVTGYSGIGKSALVHEVQKSIVHRRGHFISGKFDQFHRNIPYGALLQALQELLRQLLTETTERLAQWKRKLLDVLGFNASVIIDVLPEVELIIGPQPPAPELPPTAAQNRFNLVFESFIRSFAGPGHPLVMFLDDLQWADLSSLNLLGRLMIDPDARYLLLIGAYRDNEVDSAHPLLSTLEEIRSAHTPVSTLTLGALGREQCIEMLSEALGRPPAEVSSLAELCLRKTGGNPFFLGQFLLSLHQEGMVRFDAQAGHWTWDMDRIVHTPMTDNVVALMATKIQKLPSDTQRVLCLAACIGSVFELKILSIVDMRSARETADSLWAALREGLVVPLGDAYKFIEDRSAAAALSVEQGAPDTQTGETTRVAYRFLHDRVQQAAYSLIPEDGRREVHLRIGRMMRSALSPEERDEELFTILGHLNLGAELLTDQAERDELAELNLLAGRKAQSSAAHAVALGYLEAGLSLLGEDPWTRCYGLVLQLRTQAAEASFLGTDFPRMEQHVGEVLVHARGPLDQTRVYKVRIQASIHQHLFKNAVSDALRILALLGIELPERPTPEDGRAAFEETRAAIGERRIEELFDLPPMTDPVMLAATQILAMIVSATYIAAPALFPLIVLRSVTLAARYGNTGAVAYGYSAYGVFLSEGVADIDSAYASGKLALRLLERYEAREYAPRTRFLWSMLLQHLKEHMRETLRDTQDTYLKAIEVGDLEYAGWGAVVRQSSAFFLGQELSEFDRSGIRWVQAAEYVKHESASYYARLIHQVVHCLRGLTEQPCHLIGDLYDERKMLPLHLEANDAYGLAVFFTYKLQLCFMFGRHAEALEHAIMAERYLGALASSVHIVTFHFFAPLVRLALFSRLSPEEREGVMTRIDEAVAKLTVWAHHAPMNYGAKHALLEAERHRVRGEAEQARTEYYRAMALAREHEYRNDEALATELFSGFLRQRGEQEIAHFFLAKARHLYLSWGAEAKVRELDQAFPELRTMAAFPSTAEALPPRTRVSTTTSHEDSRSSLALDLVSVIKASQAISGEVVLTELLEKLVRIVVENAGARSGLLVFEGERPLIAVARSTSWDGEGTVTLHDNPEQLPIEFSRAIMRYVERTHTVVVLGDASREGPFQSDAYVREHRPKSVLCMPILYQKKRVGLLYLENELLANAFTPERCKVLELLAAQSAISLENAQLYDTLEARVKERTRELSEALRTLRETQKQLVLQEKLASLGSLTSGIAHELKNPLNFVNNFAQSALSLLGELREELRLQRATPTGDRAQDVDQVIDDLTLAATKISEHGTRADRIIRAMLEHARSDSGKSSRVDINEFVREYVNLAIEGHCSRPETALVRVMLQADYDETLGSEFINPENLGRVILNLAGNALYALTRKKQALGEAFTPVLGVKTRNLDNRFELRIRDNGMGINAAQKDKIFTPFFTTKPSGEGTGLGLSISHDIIVQGHGGTLEFSTQEGQYTEFIVTLPKQSPGV